MKKETLAQVFSAKLLRTSFFKIAPSIININIIIIIITIVINIILLTLF